jgi:hypothetical protein
MKAKLILKHRGDYDYFLVSRTDNSEALVASLNPDEEIFEQKLSTKNCDEIFGVVDVEKLADEFCTHKPLNRQEIREVRLVKIGFEEGFKKAMELNKGKVFTLDNMRKVIEMSRDIKYVTFSIDELIQSLQQPTEIEVEIEMENYGYCEGCRKAGIWHCAHADTCGYAETRERPKLDSQGCLILKKI